MVSLPIQHASIKGVIPVSSVQSTSTARAMLRACDCGLFQCTEVQHEGRTSSLLKLANGIYLLELDGGVEHGETLPVRATSRVMR